MVCLQSWRDMTRGALYIQLLVAFTATNSQSNMESWTARTNPWLNGRPITIMPTSHPESNQLLSPAKENQNFPPTLNSRSTVLSPVQDGHQRLTATPHHESLPATLPSYPNDILPGPAPSLNSDVSSYKPLTSLPKKRPNSFSEDDLTFPSELLGQGHLNSPSLQDRYPTSFQNSNVWTTNAPQSSNFPFIVSPYQAQGAASNYYIVAVPKPPHFAANTSTPPVQFTTKKPSSYVEIVKSIELPFGRIPYAAETSNILTKERLKADEEKENKKAKRSESDQTASTSLFRPETVNGFRALFQKSEPFMSEKNITIVDNDEMVLDRNLTGPVFYTKSAINIFVQDPGLVSVMHKKFKEISKAGESSFNSNGYQYPYPTRNHGITKRVAKILNLNDGM